jgi:membrane protein insertase Oxa1/YidC/SpoIIIJ
MPAMFVVFAFVSPSALVVYFVVSNVYRIGMQAYITRTLYHGEDSLGKQAQAAAVETKKLKEEHGRPELLPKLRRKDGESGTEGIPSSGTATAPSANANGQSGQNRPTPPKARTNTPNRSKKKKKKRR